MVIEEARASFFGRPCCQSGDGVKRQEESRIGLWIHPKEARSAHTHNREWELVDQNRPANRGRAAVEAPLPIRVSQHHHRRSARAVIGIAQQASHGGRHTQSAEVVAGNVHALNRFGLVPGNHVEGLCKRVAKQRGEGVLVRTQRLIGGEGEVGAQRTTLAIAVKGSVDPSDYPRSARRVPFGDRQFLGMGYRQSAQQNRVHKAVDGCVGADAQCQREHRGGGEQRVRRHRAQRIAKILRELFDKCKGPHGTAFLLD
jgi:hypothetical protein